MYLPLSFQALKLSRRFQIYSETRRSDSLHGRPVHCKASTFTGNYNTEEYGHPEWDSNVWTLPELHSMRRYKYFIPTDINAYGGCRDTAPFVLRLDARLGRVIGFTLRPSLPSGRQSPMVKGLGSRNPVWWRSDNSLFLPRIDLRLSRP
jgi:hypothetical protein